MEGYGGQTINTIHNNIQQDNALAQSPNLILIHAGTNDNDQDALVAEAPSQLGRVIDYLNCEVPNAVVLVAKLIQNKYKPNEANWYNSQIPDIVAQRLYKVNVVDMTMIGGDEMSDVLHPSAQGYNDMASHWYAAIEAVPHNWWTTYTTTSKTTGRTETCARGNNYFKPLLEASAPVLSGSGSGNAFKPNWEDNGIIAIGTGHPGSGVLFADLDGDGRQDYIWANYSSGAIKAWLNPADRVWNAVNGGMDIAWGLPDTSYVEMADLDGDKKAEYILVVDAHFRVFRNGGPRGNVWLWSELKDVGQGLDALFGGSAGYHYFADMNGDGRADLIKVNSNGVLDVYINTGRLEDAFNWTPCLSKGLAAQKMWFVDIDGDGRADYLSMDDAGGVSGWLNKPGDACGITWVPIGDRKPGTVALGVGASVGQVRLADLNGDGKADYAVVSDGAGTLHMWANTGTTHAATDIGVRLNDIDGDGRDDYLDITPGYSGASTHEVRFADMNGDGRDDYLVVDDATGALHCYLNLGEASTWQWSVKGEIAWGVGGVGAGLRLADFNGDGRADYIYVEENGAATVWLNLGPGDDLSNWHVINGGQLAALGVGAKREDVQFADIDGDGLADYVWIHADTVAMDVWYNTYGSQKIGWVPGGTILPGQGVPGQNVCLARMGTSGRYDYVTVAEDTGVIKVWQNLCSDVIGKVKAKPNGVCGAAPMPTSSP